MSAPPGLGRRSLAELVGTALLVTAVVGSGIMAARLSPSDAGLRLLENSVATMVALPVLIVLLGPVSGAQLNPVVTLANWWLHRRGSGSGVTSREALAFIAAQCAGAICGAVLANLMFDQPAIAWSGHRRGGLGVGLGEVVATAGLVLVIVGLTRAGRAGAIPLAVGGWIGAAYWFTSSTSFANPAVTLGRACTDSFAGIAPRSVPGFIGAQLVGLLVGLAALAGLFPAVRAPHSTVGKGQS